MIMHVSFFVYDETDNGHFYLVNEIPSCERFQIGEMESSLILFYITARSEGRFAQV